MLRVFRNDMQDPDRFVVTLELVPGRESRGRSVEKVISIARDAFNDGRISAVSITDNPGGNPSLSPDVIGYEIFKLGMDVIVHFTCRDMNRAGMESRALQLAMMGMKNILALTGDYSGSGFGGRGTPVFDLDSVNLQCLLTMIGERVMASGDPDAFFTGCAVSPFKATEAETFAQYAKLCRKISAGAQFIITQVGYDARKFQELIQIVKDMGLDIPVLGSVYLLTPGAARVMHGGKVPGAVVTDKLLTIVEQEWKIPEQGRNAAIERAARLGVVLKGLGYKGIHICGIHRSFDTAARILNRMEAIEDQWELFVPEFEFPQPNGFYVYPHDNDTGRQAWQFFKTPDQISLLDKLRFDLLSWVHDWFFNFDSPLAPFCHRLAATVDKYRYSRMVFEMIEDILKTLLLNCQKCGDCGIQHLAFQCPESGCPKHTRNGACGGSLDGFCEVYPERRCVWYRAYLRLKSNGSIDKMTDHCIHPRMWELNGTSSWLNFHLKRDHQSATTDISRFCHPRACHLTPQTDDDH